VPSDKENKNELISVEEVLKKIEILLNIIIIA